MMIRKDELVYICSPLSAPTREQIRESLEVLRTCQIPLARDGTLRIPQDMRDADLFAKFISEKFRCRAIAPHSFLPEYLDDNIPQERAVALEFGLSVLAVSKAMVVCGRRISSGMAGEIQRARELGIPVYKLEILAAGIVLAEYKEKEACA